MIRQRNSTLCGALLYGLLSFRKAALIAGLVSAIAVMLKLLDTHLSLDILTSPVVNIREVVYGSLASFVGTLVVFRTSLAYGRFWSGSTLLHEMMADWHDAASTVIAFCRYSNVPEEEKECFKQCFVRFMSLLSALTLAEMEGADDSPQALSFELLDPESLSEHVFRDLSATKGRPEVVFQWIQNLVVDGIKSGVLSIPAPLLTRTFQELGKGMLHHRDALKYSDTPFPVAYVACTEILLVAHACLTPVVTSIWMSSTIGIGIFTFIPIFLFWSLHFTAAELENPFGTDESDFDLQKMQDIMNQSLARLVMPLTQTAASLMVEPEYAARNLRMFVSRCSQRPNILRKSSRHNFVQMLEHRTRSYAEERTPSGRRSSRLSSLLNKHAEMSPEPVCDMEDIQSGDTDLAVMFERRSTSSGFDHFDGVDLPASQHGDIDIVVSGELEDTSWSAGPREHLFFMNFASVPSGQYADGQQRARLTAEEEVKHCL